MAKFAWTRGRVKIQLPCLKHNRLEPDGPPARLRLGEDLGVGVIVSEFRRMGDCIGRRIMALKTGARYVEFLDINPRAVEFQTENAKLNSFNPDSYKCILGDINTFSPESKYDVLFANPPFIPTPDKIDGTITSNGGIEGNRFMEILFKRFDAFLKPDGEALILTFQIVENDRPLILNPISQYIESRFIELTPAQESYMSFNSYFEAYMDLFPQSKKAVAEWKSYLVPDRKVAVSPHFRQNRRLFSSGPVETTVWRPQPG